jgi:hypothetical protein
MPRTQYQTRGDTASRTTTRPARRGRSTRHEAGAANPIVACIEVCNETLSYCLEQGEDHAGKEHILSLLDCIDTCWYVTGLQARDSDLGAEALRLCADACRACEESCAAFEGDATMERCAEACRECAEHCSR